MGRKSKKINPNPYYGSRENIKPSLLPKDTEVSFNLRYLCCKGKKFNYLNRNEKYFLKVVERLKIVCNLSRMELINTRDRTLRVHQIDWSDSKVSEDSFNLNEEFDEDAWQFSFSANEHGRCHGFFIKDIFYVVWFDPEHELYV